MKQSIPRPLSIAIDGPAGSGKSTVARRVSETLGYTYVNTGAMYRVIAWAVLDREIDPHDPEAVTRLAEALEIEMTPDGRIRVNGRDLTDEIRLPAISSLASPLSAIPGVRRHLVSLQKQLGAAGGVVMEGRDIGTVVLPHAEVKVFLTASLDRRVDRRKGELSQRGVMLDHHVLTEQIAARDTRDESRAMSPMQPAADAVLLDSDHLSVEEVTARIVALHTEAWQRVSA